MPANSIRILGGKKVLKNLKRWSIEKQKKAEAGVFDAVLAILEDAVSLAPYSTQNLRHSGFALTKDGSGKNLSGTFVGDNASRMSGDHAAEVATHRSQLQRLNYIAGVVAFSAFYAVYVHEVSKAYSGGTWKYLSGSIARNKRKVAKIIAKRMKK